MSNSFNLDLAERINGEVFIESFLNPFITAILGPRRVGKSTFIKWYMKNHPDNKWVVFNMDVLSQRRKMIEESLHSEIEKQALQTIGGEQKLWIVIDEAQKCPELFEQIKVIYDEFKDQDNVIKFILTGSASLDLHNLSAESLAGRIELLNMREFTIKEAAMYKHAVKDLNHSLLDTLVKSPDGIASIIKKSSHYRDILKEILDFQLVYGGLPEVIKLQTERERWRYLDQYVQSYLEKDVRNVIDVANLDLYQKLLEILAERTGLLRDGHLGLQKKMKCIIN